MIIYFKFKIYIGKGINYNYQIYMKILFTTKTLNWQNLVMCNFHVQIYRKCLTKTNIIAENGENLHEMILYIITLGHFNINENKFSILFHIFKCYRNITAFCSTRVSCNWIIFFKWDWCLTFILFSIITLPCNWYLFFTTNECWVFLRTKFHSNFSRILKISLFFF